MFALYHIRLSALRRVLLFPWFYTCRTLYAAALYSSSIYILDISNKSSFEILTIFTYPGAAHDCSITENEQILITADEMLGGGIKIWDI